MRKILTVLILFALTSCSSIRISLSEWKSEIKEDIRTGNDFNKPYLIYDNVEYSDNQPKFKVEQKVNWFEEINPYYTRYPYIPSYSYVPRYFPRYYVPRYYTPRYYVPRYSTWIF